jgi:hypothetical protein
MKRDSAGIVWMHTGDEAVFEEGYCKISGRLKYIIIRGQSYLLPVLQLLTTTAVTYSLVSPRWREYLPIRDRRTFASTSFYRSSERCGSQG